jgi:hypothetical protein
MYFALIFAIMPFLAVMIAAPYVAARGDRRRSEAALRARKAEPS